jgi:hypothetical protein
MSASAAMFRASILLCMIVTLSRGATEDDVAGLVTDFGPRLTKVRYMEQGDFRDFPVPGWEGFPTRRYTYQMKDKDGTVKSADVVMLNPSAEQISRWIVQAITEVKGSYSVEDGRKLFTHIIAQSGGQFPVTGVVYEDIIPADGVNEVYCFRDGVTVEVEGVKHRGTTPLTKEEIEASIAGNVKRVFTFARVASTSPQMWIAAGGSPDVLKDGKPTVAWLSEVRKAYQESWGKDRNPLMVAWVKANMK